MKTEEKKRIFYNNREISWLDFNLRVLEEAFKKENPIMERVKFLSICASNLDEFFMVRVAGIMEQVHANYKKEDPSGLTPKKQLAKITERTHEFLDRQYFCWETAIKKSLKNKGIVFLEISKLNKIQLEKINKYFNKIIFPVLTPLAIDRSRPFPLLSNRSLNIAVSLEKEGKSNFAVVQVPSILPRFFEVSMQEGQREFVMLEDIIMYKLDKLFELHEIKAYFPFRVTRNSDLDIDDDEREDLIIAVQKSIKKRKRGRPVRLEILKNGDSETKKFLIDMLDVEKQDVYELPGPIDLTFLSKFSELEGFEDLCFKKLVQANPPKDFVGVDDYFAAIRERDRLVHHPYESFDAVLNFVRSRVLILSQPANILLILSNPLTSVTFLNVNPEKSIRLKLVQPAKVSDMLVRLSLSPISDIFIPVRLLQSLNVLFKLIQFERSHPLILSVASETRPLNVSSRLDKPVISHPLISSVASEVHPENVPPRPPSVSCDVFQEERLRLLILPHPLNIFLKL